MVAWVEPGSEIPFLRGVVVLTHLLHSGTALGLLSRLGPEQLAALLPAIAAVAALLLGGLLWRAPRGDAWTGTAIGLIAGGAAGNLLDRTLTGAVVELLRIDLGVLVLPDFNLGDCAIAAGMALLLLDLVATESGARPAPD